MEHEAPEVARQLHDWAKKMGYVPGSKFAETKGFPSPAAFQKICKGRTIKMWQDVMRQVKPKDEVLHIQKTLLLQQLKAGIPLDKVSVPGNFTRQVVLKAKLEAREKEKKALSDSLHTLEMSIKAKEKALRKSGHKVAGLERQTAELKKKQLLFKIKSKECCSTLEYYNDIASAINNVCPPPANARPPSANPSDSAEAVLYKCVDAIKDFQSHGEELGTSDDQKIRVQQMWNQVKSNVNGWGAQQLWDALHMQILPGLVEEITELCGEEESSLKSADSQASITTKALAVLPAKHMASVVDCINLDTRCRIKAAELINLREKLIETLETKFNSFQFNTTSCNSSLLNKTTVSTPDIIRTWVEMMTKKEQLSAKLLAIKEELAHLKESTPPLPAASHDLKAAKEDLAKLDIQVDHEKSEIEKNLGSIRSVGEKLTSARATAVADRSDFNSKVPSLLQKSKPSHQFDSDSDSLSPHRKLPLSSTMIGNVTADSNLSFETTCDSITDRFVGQSNLSDLVIAIRESVSKEAKLFIKVNLETLPFIERNGRREPLCNLLVEAPMITSCTSSIPQKKFLQMVRGAPFTSAPKTILNELHLQSHLKALHFYKFLKKRSTTIDLQATGNLETIRKHNSQKETRLLEKIEEVNAALSSVDSSLQKTSNIYESWANRPVQKTVSSLNLQVDGLTFDEWCRKYDALI